MRENSYKISVIVPVYNTADYLRECVDSILGQKYRNLEIILVDDASTDGSGQLCDDYERENEQIRAIHQENGGPGSACVTGLNAAGGDYIMFVDSDDYIEPETLTEMVARLTGTAGEIVCCNHLREKQKGTEPVYSVAAPGIYQGEKLDAEIRAKLIGVEKRAVPLSRCMKLCEKSVFAGNEIYYDYRIRFGEDTNMMYPAFLKASRVVVMDGALYYHYRYVESSMIHLYDKGIYESLQRVTACLKRVIADRHVPGGMQAADREYCYMLLYVMKNELRNPDKDYRERIRSIFGAEEIRTLLQNTPITVSERSGQLLYLGMLYPGGVLLRLLRMILRIYDKR
ncbi:MAG: glycosyltransferase family 2 protein [Bacteroidales bacterium]|nr:glycosyltransferase family 2 protein [Bacteroidales bacterium]MCM1414564.1 glycosyltransferase family 2 protein [bacterium]MCM1422614.1 glycosyltransferase family 2 protein [bacterium]